MESSSANEQSRNTSSLTLVGKGDVPNTVWDVERGEPEMAPTFPCKMEDPIEEVENLVSYQAQGIKTFC